MVKSPTRRYEREARFSPRLLHLLAQWLPAFLLLVSAGWTVAQTADGKPIEVTVEWAQAAALLKSTPTLQVVVNPLLRRGSPIQDAAFNALRELGADYVRFVPWHPYPKLAVAELTPPADGKTSWDFHLIDPLVLDFLHATSGHSRILNFSTIPAWMFQTSAPVPYPDDPNRVTWNYVQGSTLRDPTMQTLVGYYTRLLDWYTKGGFIDEAGVKHVSGYRFDIPYWEVFNEIDVEHHPSPQQYTAEYDAIVTALHREHPSMKFVGLALAFEQNPKYFEYFLDHAHHRPGVPLDMISYHFYASPTRAQNIDNWQYTFFDQADRFLSDIRYIEAIRTRLSPETRTTLDEVGSILPTDWHPDTPYTPGPHIPDSYWNVSAAMYAYVYLGAARLGIDVIGESQLVGFDSQFPSVTLINPVTGKPNPRFLVLKLLKDHITLGDRMPATKITATDIDAQAFVSSHSRKLLLISKRDRVASVNIPHQFEGGIMYSVKGDAADPHLGSSTIAPGTLTLAPFAVAVLQEAQHTPIAPSATRP